jgi:excisionase family DNA binding protein
MKMYPLPEVAKILCVSVESIRRYIKLGRIKGTKVGGQWRITEESLQQYIETNSNIKG